LDLLGACARSGDATQVESPTRAARRVRLIVIPIAPKHLAGWKSTNAANTTLES
jgi:hypothetical protein